MRSIRGLRRFAQYAVTVRPRIDAADGAVLALVARDFAAFAIRVHGGVAREDAAAHGDELPLHVVKQRGERFGFEQLAALVRPAGVCDAVFELPALARRVLRVELR